MNFTLTSSFRCTQFLFYRRRAKAQRHRSYAKALQMEEGPFDALQSMRVRDEEEPFGSLGVTHRDEGEEEEEVV